MAVFVVSFLVAVVLGGLPCFALSCVCVLPLFCPVDFYYIFYFIDIYIFTLFSLVFGTVLALIMLIDFYFLGVFYE